MIHITFVDAISEPVATVLFEDHMRTDFRDSCVHVIKKYAKNPFAIIAYIAYIDNGVNARQHLTKSDMGRIDSTFDHIIDSLIHEVNEVKEGK